MTAPGIHAFRAITKEKKKLTKYKYTNSISTKGQASI